MKIKVKVKMKMKIKSFYKFKKESKKTELYGCD